MTITDGALHIAEIDVRLEQEYPDVAIENVGDVAYDVLQRALPAIPALETILGYDSGWGRRLHCTHRRMEA